MRGVIAFRRRGQSFVNQLPQLLTQLVAMGVPLEGVGAGDLVRHDSRVGAADILELLGQIEFRNLRAVARQ
jgi:hypothetical protein